VSFPISFSDIILWLASTSLILLITTELVPPHYSKINLLINRSRLRTVALALGAFFIFMVFISLFEMWLTNLYGF
jgi:hypothetical protein